MKYKEVQEVFFKLNPPVVKEVWYNNKGVYFFVNHNGAKIKSITYNQLNRLLQEYDYKVETGNTGFTTRWYTFTKPFIAC